MEELIVQNKKIKNEIINIINNSGLPAFVLTTIIKDCYEQLIKLEDKEFESAMNTINSKKQQEEEQEEEQEEQEKNNEEEE